MNCPNTLPGKSLGERMACVQTRSEPAPLMQEGFDKCAHCKTVIDRDSNGARNVLLKHLTELTARGAGDGTRAG